MCDVLSLAFVIVHAGYRPVFSNNSALLAGHSNHKILEHISHVGHKGRAWENTGQNTTGNTIFNSCLSHIGTWWAYGAQANHGNCVCVCYVTWCQVRIKFRTCIPMVDRMLRGVDRLVWVRNPHEHVFEIPAATDEMHTVCWRLRRLGDEAAARLGVKALISSVPCKTGEFELSMPFRLCKTRRFATLNFHQPLLDAAQKKQVAAEWHAARKGIPESFRKWEQKARTSNKEWKWQRGISCAPCSVE